MWTKPIRKLPWLAATMLVAAFLVAPIAPAVAARHCGPVRGPAADGRIAFSADISGTYQLYVVRADGCGLRKVTALAGADVVDPDWSPDGRWLVVTVELVDDHGPVLAMLRPDGHGMRYLTDPFPLGNESQASFSRDGRSLFFEGWDGGGAWGIFTMTLDGAHLHQVTHPKIGFFDTDPSQSPDGTKVSFVRIDEADDARAALFTQDLRTGAVRQLTPFSYNVAVKHGWSPNGRRLVFSRDAHQIEDGAFVSGNVVTIGRGGTHLRSVTTYAGGQVHGFAGSYSPDGRWVTWRRQTDATVGAYTARLAEPFSSLMIGRPDGSGARPILTVPGLVPRFIAWGQ